MVWMRSGEHVPLALPQPAVDLLFMPDGDCWLAGAETRARQGKLPAGGPLVGIRLRPETTVRAFGLAADEIPVSGASIEDLVDARSAGLISRSPDQVRDALRVLADQRGKEKDRQVEHVLRALHAAPGTPISHLAALVGLSERQLRRRFGIAVGLRPKAYARVVRLHHALALGRRSITPKWADIAVLSGFYDQSHLLAEFREAVGVAPSTLLQEEGGRFLQAVKGGR